MKFLISLSLLSSLTITIAGQSDVPASTSATATKCEITVDKSPTFRGLRLGMDEFKASAIIGASFKGDSPALTPGYTSAYSILSKSLNPQFRDVSNVRLTAIDGKVTRIEITYAPEWRRVKDFADHFIPQIPIPTDSWTYPSNYYVESKCSGFEIVLEVQGQRGVLKLRDSAAESRKLKEIERDKEAKRQALKP